jgi:hypothetical protein
MLRCAVRMKEDNEVETVRENGREKILIGKLDGKT